MSRRRRAVHARLTDAGLAITQNVKLCCGKKLKILESGYVTKYNFLWVRWLAYQEVTCKKCLKSQRYKNAILELELTR